MIFVFILQPGVVRVKRPYFQKIRLRVQRQGRVWTRVRVRARYEWQAGTLILHLYYGMQRNCRLAVHGIIQAGYV